MKTVFLLFCALAFDALAAPFANLDFESPNLRAVLASNVIGAPIRVTDAIPKWKIQIGGQEQQIIQYNSTCLTCPDSSLYDANGSGLGKFNFTMSAGVVVGSSPPVLLSTSLYQIGTVPTNARSLLFDAGVDYGSLDVSLGGSLSPVVELSGGAVALHTYGVDVTTWAGKEAELRFTINPGTSTAFGAVILDNIRFSPVALVPEPSTWALLGVGGVLLFWVVKRPKAT